MNITGIIAQHIRSVFEGGNWTEVNIADTIADISATEACTVSTASPNSIAALIQHLAFYNDIAVARLQGQHPYIDDCNGFPVTPISTAQEWMHVKETVFASVRQLCDAVNSFPEQKLQQLTATGSGSYYTLLHGIAEHAHYHLGQMVCIQKQLRGTVGSTQKNCSL